MESLFFGFFLIIFIVILLIAAWLIALLAGAIVAGLRVNQRAAAHLPSVGKAMAISFVVVLLIGCSTLLLWN